MKSPTQNKVKTPKKVLLSIVLALILTPLAYGVSAIFVFDFQQPAIFFGAEITVIGPRPYGWMVQPSYHEFYYTGKEWPFKVYRPICKFWLLSKRSWLSSQGYKAKFITG